MDTCALAQKGLKNMSNMEKRDPYRSLVKIMLVLLVLLVLLGSGYLLLNSLQKGERAKAQQRIDEENAQMVNDYQKAVSELKKQIELKKETAGLPEPKASGWDIIDASEFPVESGRSVTTTRLDALSGGLLLLNRWHELPADFGLAEQTLKSVGEVTKFKVPVKDRTVSLFPKAIDALQSFVNAAKDDGLEYYIIRQGYRSMATQTDYWNKELARHPNREGEGLVAAARQRVSYPGTSDYQSGFSFEVGVYSRDDSVINAAAFQSTDQAKYLNENGWKYGIVFRFPAQGYPSDETVDKSYVTGLSSKIKMDAYRYVGVPHAAVMNHLGFCLEEYIDYLVAHPHIMVYQDGVLKYEIYRIPETGAEQTHDIPLNATDFFVSSDNIGGLVCAISY